VLYEGASGEAVIIDPVLGQDPISGMTDGMLTDF
jgi:hypothetical protein